MDLLDQGPCGCEVPEAHHPAEGADRVERSSLDEGKRDPALAEDTCRRDARDEDEEEDDDDYDEEDDIEEYNEYVDSLQPTLVECVSGLMDELEEDDDNYKKLAEVLNKIKEIEFSK